jgi:hypothetical protein
VNETCTWCNANPAVYVIVDGTDSVSGYSCQGDLTNFIPSVFDADGNLITVAYPMRSAPNIPAAQASGN